MKTPGITVKPIILMDGAHEVNEVFFDNVKVPVENRIGEENKGWTYAKFLLVHERSGIAGVARSKKAIERLKESPTAELIDGTPLMKTDEFSRKVAELEIDLTALEYHRAAHAGPGSQGQACRPGKLDPQDQGHRGPAAHHRADGRGDRLLRLSAMTAFFGDNEYPVGPDYARRRSRAIISTCARPRSMAAPTRSSATSSRRRCWGSNAQPGSPFRLSGKERQWISPTPRSRRCSAIRSRKFLADHYDFEAFKKISRSEAGWIRRELEAVRRARPAGRAPAGRIRRAGRRPGRHHDRDGRVRPPSGGRALRLDGRGRRRLRQAWRHGRA